MRSKHQSMLHHVHVICALIRGERRQSITRSTRLTSIYEHPHHIHSFHIHLLLHKQSLDSTTTCHQIECRNSIAITVCACYNMLLCAKQAIRFGLAIDECGCTTPCDDGVFVSLVLLLMAEYGFGVGGEIGVGVERAGGCELHMTRVYAS